MSVEITTPFEIPDPFEVADLTELEAPAVVGPTPAIKEDVELHENARQNPMHRGVVPDEATPTAATEAANIGAGLGDIFSAKVGDTLELRTIQAGTNITVATVADVVTIAASGGTPAQSTVATLPAADTATAMFYCTDASFPGPCLVFSDGTDWVRIDNSQIVRAHGDVEIFSLDLSETLETTMFQTEAPEWFHDSYDRLDPFAMECVYRGDAARIANGALFGMMNSSGIGFELQVFTDGRLEWRCRVTSTSNDLRVRTTETFADSVWHRAIVLSDGTGTAAGTQVIVDGAGTTQDIVANTLSSDYLGGAGQDWSIGARAAGQHFFGDVHRVRLWSGVSWTEAQGIRASTDYPNLGQGRNDAYFRCCNGWDGIDSNNTLNNYAGAGASYIENSANRGTNLAMEFRGTRIQAAP